MRRLPLKLPFTGEERRDLVPVDWVALAITRIMQRPQWHGQCFHLTSPRPIPVREIKAVVEHELGLTGMRFEAESSVTSTESGKRVDAVYRDALRSYWPYFAGDPEFDRSNTLAALPNLPGVEVTAPVIARLIRFAVANNWGRTPIRSEVERLASCADYFEQFLPAAIADSFLADLAVTATLGFEVRGPDGGHWVYRIHEGQILEVSCDESIAADVDYHLDMPTFAKIVSGQQTPQAAFFARKVEIHGRMEMGLKLAMLFGQFVKESPYCFDQPERHHVTVR